MLGTFGVGSCGGVRSEVLCGVMCEKIIIKLA